MTSEKRNYHHHLGWTLLLIILGIWVLTWRTYAYFFPTTETGYIVLFVGFLLLSVLLPFYILLNIKKVSSSEIGVIEPYFSNSMYAIGSGAVITVPHLYPLKKEKKINTEEFIWTMQGDPIIITHGMSQNKEGDPFNSRMLTRLTINCSYEILDMKAFVSTIENKESLRQQMLNILIAETKLKFAAKSLKENSIKTHDFANELKTCLEEHYDFKKYGIKLSYIALKLDLISKNNDSGFSDNIKLIE